MVKVIAVSSQGNAQTSYQSIGSGAIIDPRGYIITNSHVIKNSSYIKIKPWFDQASEYIADVIHKQDNIDLVLLKITGSGSYPFVPLHSSHTVSIGDWVIALGNPYGMEHSASMGIVSDRDTSLWIEGKPYTDLIQTDAAVNQGNSGGPLIDMAGNIIGVNTAIYAPSGIFTGIGFAISAERVVAFISEAISAPSLQTIAAKGSAKPTVEKEPIRPGATAPHPAYGNCTNCHTFIVPKQVNSLTISSRQPAIESMQSQPKRSPGASAITKKVPLQLSSWLQKISRNQDFYVICRAFAFIFAASVLFNMLGLGGGFFYVPILLLFGVSFHVASATSLFMITTANLVAAYVFWRSELVDTELALILEPITCLGALLGGLYSDGLGEVPSSVLFGSCLFLVSYFIYRNPVDRLAVTPLMFSKLCWQRSFGAYQYSVDLTIALPLVFCIGYLGGMLGFAGGIIKVPMLVLLFGVPLKVAIATSSLMVAITSFVGCLGHTIAGHFDFPLSISLAIIAILGASVGAKLAVKSEAHILKQLFSMVTFLIAIWMILRVI